MKNSGARKEEAAFNGDQSTVCGVIGSNPDQPDVPGSGVGTVYRNVKGTCKVKRGGDACALPRSNYAFYYPFALEDIGELGDLQFRPDLCGHVLNIQCGDGPNLDIIVTNSNQGGGIDLYSKSTWYTFS
jgi:hypothetical protein